MLKQSVGALAKISHSGEIRWWRKDLLWGKKKSEVLFPKIPINLHLFEEVK